MMEVKNRRHRLFERGEELHFKIKNSLSGIVQNPGITTNTINDWRKEVHQISKEVALHFGEIDSYLKLIDESEIKFLCPQCGHGTPTKKAFREPTDEAGVYETYVCEKCGFEDWVDNCECGKVDESIL